MVHQRLNKNYLLNFSILEGFNEVEIEEIL